MNKKNTKSLKNRKKLVNKINQKQSDKDSGVTPKQRAEAKKAIKNAKDAFNISGQIPAKDINLATEYLSHDGQIVRKSKSATTRAKNKAKAVLARRVRLIDAVRAVLPAVNNLQSEFLSQEQGLRILTDMLKHHGYTKEDLYAAAKRVGKRTADHYHNVIKNYMKNYTKKNTKGSNK